MKGKFNNEREARIYSKWMYDEIWSNADLGETVAYGLDGDNDWYVWYQDVQGFVTFHWFTNESDARNAALTLVNIYGLIQDGQCDDCGSFYTLGSDDHDGETGLCWECSPNPKEEYPND